MARGDFIRRALAEHPWAMLESYLDVFVEVLDRHAHHVVLSEEDIQAKTGKRADAPDDPLVSIGSNGVAVMRMHGVISNRMNMLSQISGGTSTEHFEHAFQSLVDDPDVSAIVFDVNSPGGSVYGLDELHSRILAARGSKPIVAHVNALAASAAYWLASAADQIVITPSGDAGSIGVFAVHQEFSAQEAKDGVKTTIIRAGRFKAEGNPHEPLSDDAQKAMQERVDEAHARFLESVAKGRGIPVNAVKTGFGQGRVLSAQNAKKAGMVDVVATFADTFQRVASAAADRRTSIQTRRASATDQEPQATSQEQVPHSVRLARYRMEFAAL